jgi:Fic family protein
MGKEKVHFQAPDSALLEEEMARFIAWFNASTNANANTSTGAMDLVIKAAIAHLWFVTIHPFEDGNGRIARALTDMLLARSDESNQRFYSMSAQIRIERKQYYAILEKTQRGDVDITDWIVWFLHCLIRALRATDSNHASVLFKAEFWQKHIHTALNDRQRKLLKKILDGFDGKLTSSKWAKIAKCSKDSAVRDINDLIEKGILQKDVAGGRSTSYELIGMPTDNEA